MALRLAAATVNIITAITFYLVLARLKSANNDAIFGSSLYRDSFAGCAKSLIPLSRIAPVMQYETYYYLLSWTDCLPRLRPFEAHRTDVIALLQGRLANDVRRFVETFAAIDDTGIELEIETVSACRQVDQVSTEAASSANQSLDRPMPHAGDHVLGHFQELLFLQCCGCY